MAGELIPVEISPASEFLIMATWIMDGLFMFYTLLKIHFLLELCILVPIKYFFLSYLLAL